MARVLITGFCAVPGPTRTGVQLRHVVRALSVDHHVDLLVVRDVDQAYVERQGNVRILRVPTPEADLGTQLQAFQRALRRQLEGADYDVVHCRDGWTARTVLAARELFGFAVVFDLTRAAWRAAGIDPAAAPELAAQHDAAQDEALAAADLVLVPTEPARRYAVARTAPERVVLSPPGVDVDRFDWEEGAASDGTPVVLYAGPIEAGRGLRTLLRAMPALLAETPARLRLVGPVAPEFSAPLAERIEELGLGDHVELRPAVDHDAMARVIAEAAVCVAPSAPELVPRATALYPTKLLEYLACRRPVVAPRCGTVGMVLEHGRDALLFAHRDPADLARKLARLLADRELRDRLARHGYERVRRDFTASAARRAVIGAYRGLAARPELRARFAAVVEPSGVTSTPPGPPPGPPDEEGEVTVFEPAPTGGGPARLPVSVLPAVADEESFTGTSPGAPVPDAPAGERPDSADDTAVRALLVFEDVTDAPQDVPSAPEVAPADAGDGWLVRAGAGASAAGEAERASGDGAAVPVDGTVDGRHGEDATTRVVREREPVASSPDARAADTAVTATTP